MLIGLGRPMVTDMAKGKGCEIWFRNPQYYIREIVECNENTVIWDAGYLIKRHIDPRKFMELNFTGRDYRYIVVSDWGAAEYDNSGVLPLAVYPVWEYGDDFDTLEDYVATPAGENEDAYNDEFTPRERRAVKDQRHVVVVTQMPDLTTGIGKKFVSMLRDLQAEYPKCMIHVHGTYAPYTLIGLGFKSIDSEMRAPAANGVVWMPNGKRAVVGKESMVRYTKWITLLDFKPVDLNNPRNRCMFNIRSLRWAAANYTRNAKIAFRIAAERVDSTSSDEDYEPETAGAIVTRHKVESTPGDKYICNSCSLMFDCKFFREGSVCTLPKAEPRELAKFFGTRDVSHILDGLSAVAQITANRLQMGVDEEEDFGLNPEVTKISHELVDQAIKMAKIIDPSLRGSKGVQINVGHGGAAAVQIGDARDFVSAAIRSLEQSGIPRDKITPEMVNNVLAGTGATKALETGETIYEAEVVNG